MKLDDDFDFEELEEELEKSFAFKDLAVEEHFQQNTPISMVDTDNHQTMQNDLEKQDLTKNGVPSCNICDYKSGSKFTMREHIKRKHSRKTTIKVTCRYEGCVYKGRRESELKKHFLHVHVSDTGINRRSSLRSHTKKKHITKSHCHKKKI